MTNKKQRPQPPVTAKLEAPGVARKSAKSNVQPFEAKARGQMGFWLKKEKILENQGFLPREKK